MLSLVCHKNFNVAPRNKSLVLVTTCDEFIWPFLAILNENGNSMILTNGMVSDNAFLH